MYLFLLLLLVPSLTAEILLTDDEIQELQDLTREMDKNCSFIHTLIGNLVKSVPEDAVTFYIYNQENPIEVEVFQRDSRNVVDIAKFNLDIPTVVIIHGWKSSYNSGFNDMIGDSYLRNADYNIVNVNWDTLSDYSYPSSYAAVPYVGQYVAEFFGNISEAYKYSLDNVMIVGHSLGAHIAGFAGKATSGKLHSITGLDCAGPLYPKNCSNDRLNYSDAQYVQAIHTNGFLWGVDFNVGDADYWPNGGYTQPGCLLKLACSHSRSYLYFNESLVSDQFVARKCSSYEEYLEGFCGDNEKAIMGGVTVNRKILGAFYLNTASKSPYALGDTDPLY